MKALIRYALCYDLRIQYLDGKISFHPQKNIFSLNMQTGFVSTDIPVAELNKLNRTPCNFLTDSFSYKDCFEAIANTMQIIENTHVNISVNKRFCNIHFSSGSSSTFSQNVGRIALCKRGCVYFQDFALESDNAKLYESIKNAYEKIDNRLSEQIGTYSALPSHTSVFILTPKAAAFFVHEVIGHIFEQDNWNIKENIIKIDEAFLPPYCTLVDDPTKSSYFKYGDYDDAGNKTLATTIVENGYFKKCITLQRSAEYTKLPMPRMSNFRLLDNPKGRDFFEICSAYSNYIVIEEITNGGLFPETGDFFISCSKQYYSDCNGEKHILFPSTYTGRINDLCNKIIEVGNDATDFIGICSKNQQNIFVNNSAPSIVISGLTALE